MRFFSTNADPDFIMSVGSTIQVGYLFSWMDKGKLKWKKFALIWQWASLFHFQHIFDHDAPLTKPNKKNWKKIPKMEKANHWCSRTWLHCPWSMWPHFRNHPWLPPPWQSPCVSWATNCFTRAFNALMMFVFVIHHWQICSPFFWKKSTRAP